MPQSPLPEVSDQRPGEVAGEAFQRTAPAPLRARRLYAASRIGSAGSVQQACSLWPVVPCQRPNSDRDCRRSQAPGSRGRFPQRIAYLGPESSPSPARALCHPSRGAEPGPLPLDSPSVPLLLTRKSAQPCLPRQVRGRLEACLSPEPTRVLRAAEALGRSASIPILPASTVPYRLGGLRQATLRRTRTRAALPGPLHPSRGHLQSPTPGL